MEARLEARWHELGGFWEGEERLLGRYQTDDSVRGGLDELFASISQSGSAAARYVFVFNLWSNSADMVIEPQRLIRTMRPSD